MIQGAESPLVLGVVVEVLLASTQITLCLTRFSSLTLSDSMSPVLVKMTILQVEVPMTPLLAVVVMIALMAVVVMIALMVELAQIS